MKASGIGADIDEAGAVRSVYDGRYVFTRYFSPKQHNRPVTMEALRRLNDLELYRHAGRPPGDEQPGRPSAAAASLLLAMNAKLNQLIDSEVGEDRGQMLPGGVDAGWEVSRETMAGA
jgi:hypothetical protein